MGDIADYMIDQMYEVDWEGDPCDYQPGSRYGTLTCAYCGTFCMWGQTESGKWRLHNYQGGMVHTCKEFFESRKG